jgi:hypothetical protein
MGGDNAREDECCTVAALNIELLNYSAIFTACFHQEHAIP